MKKIPVFIPDTGNSASPVAKPYQRIDADGTPNKSGDYILFGEYPQTKVTDEATLSALGDCDSYTWTSYGYYRNGEVSDFMKYTDKEYNGERYRGVYFTKYRLDYCDDSPENNCQYANGYFTSELYWFKYEPIKWHILSEENGEALILCETVIDCQQWANKTYRNLYAESSIRAWLNDTFYKTAFSGLQQKLIQTTEIDNSMLSMGLVHYEFDDLDTKDTNDKVFLLSYKEAANTEYGFFPKKDSTDYAKCQGCWNPHSDENSPWWLRSPAAPNCPYIYLGDHSLRDLRAVNVGVVPALTI